jgi:Na+/proline symporter
MTDAIAIAIFLAMTAWLGFRASGSRTLRDYFTGGGNMPWYLAGLSMAATTFAADTPLAVTELVRRYGVSGNWYWWNMLAGGMLTAVFFARYWRRAGVTTDVELISIRYSGRAARFLRLFKAVYFGLFLNAVILGWVNLALVSLFEAYFGMGYGAAFAWTAAAMLLTLAYTSVAGLRGVIWADAAQFGVAMVGCTALALYAVDSVGGGGALRSLPQTDFFPGEGGLTLSFGAFLALAGVQWWASWYPGNEPGGGGYISQRLIAAKNENHARAAAFFFQFLHYAVRPWPWILVALATFVLYPDLSPENHRMGYLYAMRDVLPAGVRSLLLAAFLAAYMSTVSTHLNWGASYLTNDFLLILRPGMRRPRRAAGWATVVVALAGVVAAAVAESVSGAWRFLLECGAGMGGVLIARWYWWRVSAYSEIVAVLVPVFVFGAQKMWFHVMDGGDETTSFFVFPNTYYITVAATTVAWIVAGYVFPQTDESVLKSFYERVRPEGWWSPYSTGKRGWRTLIPAVFGWTMATAAGYALIFGVGKAALADFADAALYGFAALVCMTAAFFLLRSQD